MWSEPISVAGPEASALPIAAAKEFLRIGSDDTHFDIEIGGWIAGVIDDAERITSTRLITQSIELRADGFADLAHLPIGPIQAVTSVGYLDTAGALQQLPDEAFELEGAGLECGIVLIGSRPAIARRRGAIRVRLDVGYGDTDGDIPPSIRIALLRAVRGHFDDNPIELAPMLNNRRIWL